MLLSMPVNHVLESALTEGNKSRTNIVCKVKGDKNENNKKDKNFRH